MGGGTRRDFLAKAVIGTAALATTSIAGAQPRDPRRHPRNDFVRNRRTPSISIERDGFTAMSRREEGDFPGLPQDPPREPPEDPYDPPDNPNSPPCYVQYHIWATKGDCEAKRRKKRKWQKWMWNRLDNTCEFRETPSWAREISSPIYPLIGPYDGGDPEVIRWHINLAQAAGVDGFFVSVYSWKNKNRERIRRNFETVLQVADEENFKVGIEAWQESYSVKETWKNEIIDLYNSYGHHSSFLKIKDKPAFWFAFHRKWMSNPELKEFFEREDAFWIAGGGLSMNELSNLKSGLLRSEATRYVDYNWPSSQGWGINPNHNNELSELRSRGLDDYRHGYPHFDERMIVDSGHRNDRYGLSKNGLYLRNIVAGPSGSLIESMNDDQETTMLEPGYDMSEVWVRGRRPDTIIYNGDPYRPLKTLAGANGKTWVQPKPPCEIVDLELLIQDITSCS